MICNQCGTLNENQRDACVRCSKPLHPAGMKGKIACAIHANREATTACGSCAVRLCDACAVRAGGVDFCENCAPQEAVRHDFDEDYERIPVVNPATAEHAAFGSRFLGLLIDGTIILFTTFLIGFITWVCTGKINFFLSPTGGGWAFWTFWGIVLLVTMVYAGIMTSMTGQTVGKQIAGVIVLEPDGHILNLQTSLLRSLFAVLSALPLFLGFFWALWDPHHQTWHDKLAGTAAYRWEELS